MSGPYTTLAAIKRDHKRWFSPDTLRFFNGRVEPTIYGGCIFVSSEQCPWGSHPRLWTVRIATTNGGSPGAIRDVGGFQAYASSAAAHTAAERAAHLLCLLAR